MAMKRSSSPKLSRRLMAYFAADVIEQGQAEFAQGGVMAVKLSPHGARAEVVDSQIFEVSLNLSRASMGEASAYCQCSHFATGVMCRHLWAFLLALDDKDLPDVSASKVRLSLIVGSNLDLESSVSSGWRRLLNQKLKRPNPVVLQEDGTSTLSPKSSEIFIVLEASTYTADSLQFRFFELERLADSKWGPIKPLALPQNGKVRGAPAELQIYLQALATLALGELSRRDQYASYRHYANPSIRTLDPASFRPLLSGLLNTKRVFDSAESGTSSLTSGQDLSLRPAQFGEVHLKVNEIGAGYTLSADIEVGANNLRPMVDLVAFGPSGLFRIGQELGFLELSEATEAWLEELRRGQILAPFVDTEAFLEALFLQEFKVELPASLQWAEKSVDPIPELFIFPDHEKGAERFQLELKFNYGPRSVSFDSPLKLLPVEAETCFYKRDRMKEELIYEGLPQEKTSLQSQNLVQFVKSVLDLGLNVYVENQRVSAEGNLKVQVTSNQDWFDVKGEVHFSTEAVSLPSLLEALQKGERFVKLKSGGLGLIDPQMQRRVESLSDFGRTQGEGFRFAKAQGFLLNALVGEGSSEDVFDESFRELKEKIRRFSGVDQREPVKSFQGELRGYQKEGLGWLHFLSDFGFGGILADDMGLGKTVQCLAYLESRRLKNKVKRPTLLVAPKSLLENWRLEAKAFTPQMKVMLYSGALRAETLKDFDQQDLIVTTYHTLLREVSLFQELEWDAIILDEAQAIKNPEAQISKAVKSIPSNFRLAMTGTPIENSVQDLFSISDFVNPGFLPYSGRRTQLKLGEGARQTLAQAFKPVILRRTKDEVLKDLPEKTEQCITVELEGEQLKKYVELKDFYRKNLLKEIGDTGVNHSKIQILAALTRLRQAALHSALVDPEQTEIRSSKFEVALEMLEELIQEGQKVLVFSQFTRLLALFKPELERRQIEYAYLDGKTKNRQDVIDQFRNSQCPVFLMSLKAGGVGLNLVEASYVFLLDPWWNPAVEAQAIDRVHRIGQKRAVNAYRFIAKDTVEEKIMELQNSKRRLSDQILSPDANFMRQLSAKDIAHLFD